MIVDLTQTIHEDMQVFEKKVKPLQIPWANLKTHGYDLELIFMSSHTGTHMDAPKHFGYKTSIDEIAIDRFVSDARLLRIKKSKDELITRGDLLAYDIDTKSVIISTSWEDKKDEDEYLTANPGLSIDAAEYLVEKKVNLVGIDTASIDAAKDDKFSAHHILLRHSILIVENLCNLKNLPDRFKLIVLPLKLRGATGSPVRVIAIY
ncbi:MAG: cyclase [Candidatus Nitrosocaldaceae archaeon]|nr:MAG: cyclase [Candidatus Nitrosocaldaceae archaeon]